MFNDYKTLKNKVPVIVFHMIYCLDTKNATAKVHVKVCTQNRSHFLVLCLLPMHFLSVIVF